MIRIPSPNHESGLRQHAAADLVFLDALEQCLEIAFAETFVAFALDDLEEDRTDHRAREDLQQDTVDRRAVDQDVQLAQPRKPPV